jgi:hypothetical protein
MPACSQLKMVSGGAHRLITVCCTVLLLLDNASQLGVAAQDPSGSFVPAPAPTFAAQAPFARSSRYVLAPKPSANALDAVAAVPFAAQAPGTAPAPLPAASFARTEKFTLPARPRDAAFAPTNASTTAAAVEANSPGAFVTTSGTNFVQNSQVRYFSGANDYFLVLS